MAQEAFLIYGAGAMGSLLGGLFSRHSPTYLVARGPHVKAVEEKGLDMEGETVGNFRPRAAVDLDELASQLSRDGASITHCIVFTKSYDTKQVLGEISGRDDIIGENVILVSLQNGLDNEGIFSTFMPRNPIIGGYTCHGVIHDGPGHIIHTGNGATVVGPYGNISREEVDSFTGYLERAGIAATVKDDIRRWIFKKVMINAAINSLTAILSVPNGDLLEHEETKLLMKQVVREGCAVAEKMGMDICPITVLDMADDVARKTCGNRSSMLQDIERGGRTEIDCINGAIVRLGRTVGVDTPVNETLTMLVKARRSG